MKRLRALAVIGCAAVLGLALAGCGGGGGGGGFKLNTDAPTSPETPVVSPESIDIETYQIEITDAVVVFDEEAGCDDLFVNAHITYNRDEARGGNETTSANQLNVFAKQGTETLSSSSMTDADGAWLTDATDRDAEFASGDSVDIIYGWRINNYDDPVVVEFSRYVAEDNPNQFTVDVSACQTAECKAAEEAAAAELEAKKAAGQVDIESATIVCADGWYVDESDEKRATLKNDELGSGYLKFSQYSNATAAEWADNLNGNFGGDLTIENVTVNGTNYYKLCPTDTQFILLADTSQGNALEIYGMFLTQEQAQAQLDNVTVK